MKNIGHVCIHLCDPSLEIHVEFDSEVDIPEHELPKEFAKTVFESLTVALATIAEERTIN